MLFWNSMIHCNLEFSFSLLGFFALIFSPLFSLYYHGSCQLWRLSACCLESVSSSRTALCALVLCHRTAANAHGTSSHLEFLFWGSLRSFCGFCVDPCAMDSRKQKRNEIWTYLNTSWKSGNMDGAFPSTILAWHEIIVVYHGFPFSYCPVGWPWISISMSLNFAW